MIKCRTSLLSLVRAKRLTNEHLKEATAFVSPHLREIAEDQCTCRRHRQHRCELRRTDEGNGHFGGAAEGVLPRARWRMRTGMPGALPPTAPTLCGVWCGRRPTMADRSNCLRFAAVSFMGFTDSADHNA